MNSMLNRLRSLPRPHSFIAFGLVLLLALSSGKSALGQERNNAPDADPVMLVHIFSVADLVAPAPDYAFEGVQLPGLQGQSATPLGGFGGGLGGFGGGGLGGGGLGGGGFGGNGDANGGGGGGFFQVGGGGFGGAGGMDASPSRSDRSPATKRFGIHDLIEVIQTTIEPESWDQMGGPGNIARLGTMLVVRQSAEVIDEIDTLLRGIRRTGGTLRSVTIRAAWLLLDPGKLKEITLANGAIDRDAVDAIVAASGASGQITCFDGQTVHIVSGRLQSGVSSVTPVVGQTFPGSTFPEDLDTTPGVGVPDEVLAQQFEPQVRQSDVGYQPVLQTANFGALLQVTPAVDAARQGVVLDLRSLVARHAAEPHPAVEFRNVMPLDRLDVVVQQFMTTLHMPLGEPRIIAGSTLEPFAKENASAQLYLIVEVNLSSPD